MANKKTVRAGTRVIITRIICIIIAGLMMLGVVIAAILSAIAAEKVSQHTENTVYCTFEPLSTRSTAVIQIGGEYIVG